MYFQTSKLVLDEYFSGEPIHDVAQFYSFDSLPQPILPEEFAAPGPLSPPESLPSPEIIPNGENTAEDGEDNFSKVSLCVCLCVLAVDDNVLLFTSNIYSLFTRHVFKLPFLRYLEKRLLSLITNLC